MQHVRAKYGSGAQQGHRNGAYREKIPPQVQRTQESNPQSAIGQGIQKAMTSHDRSDHQPDQKKGKELAKYAEKNEFSYAYLKELYISTMFEALSNNREAPTEKDVNTSLNRLIKDKSLLHGGSINMDNYFKG